MSRGAKPTDGKWSNRIIKKLKSVIIATTSTPETPTEPLVKTFDNVETGKEFMTKIALLRNGSTRN
jgi:hypothetical protein